MKYCLILGNKFDLLSMTKIEDLVFKSLAAQLMPDTLWQG